jgi:hypothetical protein
MQKGIRRLLTVATVAATIVAGSAGAAVAAKVEKSTAGPTATSSDARSAALSLILKQTTRSGNGDLWWDYCLDQAASLKIIFLEASTRYCGSGSGQVVGFASVTTNGYASYVLEICDYDVSAFWMGVNPYDQNGNQTDTVLWYSDPPGGGCYKAAKYYPIRKFEARSGSEAVGIYSPWVGVSL